MQSRALGNTLLLMVSTLASLAAAECTARALVPAPWGRPVEELQHLVPIAFSPGAFVPDEVLGYRPAPDFEGRVVRAGEYDTEFHTNAQGLRDGEIGLREPGVPRVLVVGDSFVWGTGVGQSQAFPQVLETELGADGRRHEVLNGGVGGFGLDQYALWLERLLPTFRPDLVLVAVFLGNDMVRYPPPEAQPVARPIVARDGHRVRYRGELEYWLRRHSRLAYVMLRRLDSRVATVRGGTIDEVVTSAWPYLGGMRARVERAGGAFGVVLVPDRVLFQIVDTGPSFDYARAERERSTIVAARIELRRLLERNGVATFDLTPHLARMPVDETYHAVDGHWTAEGHRRVAALLAPWVRELLVGRGPPPVYPQGAVQDATDQTAPRSQRPVGARP